MRHIGGQRAIHQIGNSVKANGGTAVSYTHLDVYKRQTQAEAGTVLGVSEGTIAWRMSEVKKRLRAMAAEDAK